MAKRSPLGEKLDQIRSRIAAAAIKAKREPSEVTLVAVTKAAGLEQIREILQLGVVDLGENRVQQLAQRAGQVAEFLQRRHSFGEAGLPEKARWHMIGHLQRNKAKQVLPIISLVHSIDSLRLAEELDLLGEKLGRKTPVLLQVNTSEEEQKFGVAVGAAIHLAEQIDSMPHLQLSGLMTMAAQAVPEPKIRQAFARAKELFEEMKWHKIGGNHLRHLSMGMSDDFEQAIAEGSTMVRIGSAIFGGKIVDHDAENDG